LRDAGSLRLGGFIAILGMKGKSSEEEAGWVSRQPIGRAGGVRDGSSGCITSQAIAGDPQALFPRA
jgi:hypothetical protein